MAGYSIRPLSAFLERSLTIGQEITIAPVDMPSTPSLQRSLTIGQEITPAQVIRLSDPLTFNVA